MVWKTVITRGRAALALAVLLVVALAFGAGLITGTSRAPAAQAHPRTAALPGPIYLALGDSYPYGLQPPDGDVAPYRHGYADQLAARLGDTLVNMACPGETSATFLNGGCEGLAAVKTPYATLGATSQIAAAEAYIKANPGRVGLVTLEVGFNDLVPCADATFHLDQACVSAKLPETFAHLTAIAGRVRVALDASGDRGARLVMLNSIDPLQDAAPYTLPAILQLDATIDAAALTTPGAVLVDEAGAFHTYDYPSGGNPYICQWTWGCDPRVATDPSGMYLHPNTTGYGVIAAAIAERLAE